MIKCYCEICGKLLHKNAYYYKNKRCRKCMNLDRKNPAITKIRKGKKYEDFVSKEKAYLWRKHISEGTKGKIISKKHRKILSKLKLNSKMPESQKEKLRNKFYEYLKTNPKEFAKRYKTRKQHNIFVNELIKKYIKEGYEILKPIEPDIIIKKGNKVFAVEVERNWSKGLTTKIRAYRANKLFKKIIFWDFNKNSKLIHLKNRKQLT